jgi:uncharacterized protein (UPF0335 family)
MSADEAPGIGHNSEATEAGSVSGARLKTYLERIERLEEEKSGPADDIKDIYVEAKASGFDVKTLYKIVSLRKIEAEKRREADETLTSCCRPSGTPSSAQSVVTARICPRVSSASC